MKKEFTWGFHGGAVDRNPPAIAGDQGSRTTPQAAKQLSPCATTTESCTPQPVLHKGNHRSEKPMHHN